jgi:uroporphyrinogen-III synthase
MIAGALAGRHIVVTRPAEQAEELCAAIAAQGGIPVRFPVLAIFDVADTGPLEDVTRRLEEFDLAVFVSPNAASRALAFITARRPWPARLRAAGMGEASARTIAGFGVADVLVPAGRSDSEALLERPELQAMAGRRVAIFRGDGGRELLAETLRARGARVEHVECYRRARADADPEPLLALWGRGELDAVTVTSSEGLRNLVELVGAAGAEPLRRTPLFVPHERIGAQARRLGFARVVPTGAGDAGLLAGLMSYFEEPRDE